MTYIESLRRCTLENQFSDAAELKEIEKSIRKEVQDALKNAKAGPVPPMEDLYSNIWCKGDNYELEDTPKYIRLPNVEASVGSIYSTGKA